MVDAGFVYTEPHSKRLKLKIKIQSNVETKAILETSLIVEFVVENLQCDDCKRTWTPNTWNSVVQLRQKVDYKRTILYAEQVILKNNMHAKTINVKEMPDGIDFFYSNKLDALALSDFLHTQILSRTKQSKKLISADKSSNDYNYNYSFVVELAPICKEDLVFINPKLQKLLGGASAVGLVIRVASMILLLDIVSLKTYAIDEATYWTHEIPAICSKRQLSEFVVINISEVKKSVEQKTGKGKMTQFEKTCDYTVAEVELQRLTDFGENDKRFFARTHLGGILKIDDHVLGYDMESLSMLAIEMNKEDLPDIILVKKIYTGDQTKSKKRNWKLKHIEKELGEDKHKAHRQTDREVLFFHFKYTSIGKRV